MSAAGAPSCFFKIRNRAGLFLNNRFTCVAECLERMVVVAVARGVVMVVDFDDDDDVMAKKFACRPMAGVLFATDLAMPKRDIFDQSTCQSTRPPTYCCLCCVRTLASCLLSY